MDSVIGLTISSNLPENRRKVLYKAQDRALTYFEHLNKRSMRIGKTKFEVWGHGDMGKRIHTTPDGSLLALIGSPHGNVVWDDVQEGLSSSKFELPWDGRVILLRVSSDGKRWTMWNDWLGSIPVYYAEIESGRIASTLEPVTVAAAGYTPNDFFIPGLVCLLFNGHFISNWTLYKGMKTIPPDSVSEWEESGFRTKQVWSVKPGQDRWETCWDDLVDEMHELSFRAIADILKTQSTWILPLSSGLDSRLIAGVAADVGANLYTYAYGASDMTDVVYSRQIAKTLGFPWKHIGLPNDFLTKYTRRWADWYGSSLHFHGMYQMAFLDEIADEPEGPILSGLIGETIVGDGLSEHTKFQHTHPAIDRVGREWFTFWKSDELISLMKVSIEEAIETNAAEIKKLVDNALGATFQKVQYLRLWGRQRFFTSYQATLSDYWRGVTNPFMNRAYARFCLSLPLAALDGRRLQEDVYRRYYGRLAVIPGTYASDPLILTGRYLLLRRIAEFLPKTIHWGILKGFDDIPPRMDIVSIQANGMHALWPISEKKEQLLEWLDYSRIEQDYQTLMNSKKDVRPLRRLQSIQTLAYRLLEI
jgi:hypothetical protein